MPEVKISILDKAEIDECRQMQAIVWQHYFLKEKNMEVPLLLRSRKNLEYYMQKSPGRILIAKENEKMIGSIACHIWGKVGWFGPFEVRPENQNRGVGKILAMAAVEFLKGEKCETIGLETMTTSTRNVAFYSKLGFKPKKLSYVLHRDLTRNPPRPMNIAPRAIAEPDMPRLRQIWNDIHHGLDYSCEVGSTKKFELGEAVAIDGNEMLDHVIFHDYGLIENSDTTLIKLMVSGTASLDLLDWCENRTLATGKKGIFVRFYQGNGIELETLLKRGYQLTGTLVRMQSHGSDESTEVGHISCWSG